MKRHVGEYPILVLLDSAQVSKRTNISVRLGKMRRIPSKLNRFAQLPLYLLIILRCLSTGTFRGTAYKWMKIWVSEFPCVRNPVTGRPFPGYRSGNWSHDSYLGGTKITTRKLDVILYGHGCFEGSTSLPTTEFSSEGSGYT